MAQRIEELQKCHQDAAGKDQSRCDYEGRSEIPGMVRDDSAQHRPDHLAKTKGRSEHPNQAG